MMCEKCGYFYNITKDIRESQLQGGSINTIINSAIDKYIKTKDLTASDVIDIKEDDILNNDQFNNMLNKRDKASLLKKIKSLNKSSFGENKTTKAVFNDFNRYLSMPEYSITVTPSVLKKVSPAMIKSSSLWRQLDSNEQLEFTKFLKAIDGSYDTEALVSHSSIPLEHQASQSQHASHDTKTAYYICRFCNNYKRIVPGEVIHQERYNASSESTQTTATFEDFSFAKYDNTLMRTRNYICKNPNCDSHRVTDTKEAIMTKNNQGILVYVCVVCDAYWTNSY